MGTVNCCKKPDEVEISGGQNYAQVLNTDQVSPLEKDNSYPHDSEQIYKNAGNAVPNQQLYNEQAQTSKDGNAFEVQVDVQNPNENQQNNEQNDQNEQLENNEQNEEETHNLQNSYGERGNEEDFAVDKEENEQHENSPKVEDTKKEEEEKEVEQVVKPVEEQVKKEEKHDLNIEEIHESNIVQPHDQDQGQKEQYNNALNDFGATLEETTYIKADSSSGVNVQQQAGNVQVASFQNENDLNKYFNDVGNSNINTFSLIQNNNSQLISTGDANNLQNLSTTGINGSQINPNEDINKYFQQNTSNDFNNLGTLSSVPAPIGNEDLNKYFQNVPGTTSTTINFDLNNLGTLSSVPAPTGNEDFNKYFQNIETTNSTTPALSSVGISGTSSTIPAPTGVDNINNYLNNNINLGQTTATGTFDINAGQVTTSISGNVDLSQLGINANASTTNENVDLSQYGLGIASAVQPQSNENDINKYFQQNASSTSMIGNFDLNNLNNPEFSSMALPQNGNYNLGESHITFGENNFTSYELKQNQVITSSSRQENSYVSPAQSYSCNYSYIMPATSQVSK